MHILAFAKAAVKKREEAAKITEEDNTGSTDSDLDLIQNGWGFAVCEISPHEALLDGAKVLSQEHNKVIGMNSLANYKIGKTNVEDALTKHTAKLQTMYEQVEFVVAPLMRMHADRYPKPAATKKK